MIVEIEIFQRLSLLFLSKCFLCKIHRLQHKLKIKNIDKSCFPRGLFLCKAQRVFRNVVQDRILDFITLPYDEIQMKTEYKHVSCCLTLQIFRCYSAEKSLTEQEKATIRKAWIITARVWSQTFESRHEDKRTMSHSLLHESSLWMFK